MGFAERYGLIEKKAIQLDDMDVPLRNRLYNAIHKYCEPSPFIHDELIFVVDKLGYLNEGTDIKNWRVLDILLLKAREDTPWYMPYEIIEQFFAAKRARCQKCQYDCHERGGSCDELIWLTEVPKVINAILEEEKSGYRFLEEKFVNIVSETELETISEASKSPYQSVNTHIKKAVSLYSDRKKPDYENSIKESISAVEAMCCIITGMTGASATLGAALKKLEDNGVTIHGALRDAFSKMYGYASDADGIRHGGIDFKNAPAEDAKYMLISCSAFVNYLVEKHSKIVT